MIEIRTPVMLAAAILAGLSGSAAQEGGGKAALLTPQQALEDFKVRPGFHLELAAAEPMIADPVAAVFDADGRLFVLEYPQYNEDWAKQKSERRGRVRLLIDGNDDGVFDKATTFVDELDNPMSVACWAGGIYVGASPDLWFFRDSDGDGVADEKRKVFTGFGQETQRAGYAQLNSIVWGLDNRFHACTNYSGGDVKRVDAGDDEAVSVRNRGFVFDPRSGSFDTESGGGQHGMCFDDWGNLFTCRNSDPIQHYFYDDRRLRGNDYHKPPSALVSILEIGKYTSLHRISPDEEWRVIRTRRRAAGEFKGPVEGGGTPSGYFTAATGVTIYRGDAWPEKYRGSALVGEASNNLVFRADLEQDGVGFVARRGDEDELGMEFIASTDNAFRPVQFAHAPDGNLLMLDMYRHLIEGAGFLPPDVVDAMEVLGGSGKGRIYRIVADGKERRPTPKLRDLPTLDLAALLEHENAWHRETAARLLYERQDAAAEPALRELVARNSLPLARLHGAWLLRGLGLEMDGEILRLMHAGEARLRRHGALLAGERAAESEDIAESLVQLTRDAAMPVRYTAAMEIEGLDDKAQRIRAIAAILHEDGDDSWMRAAAMSSLRGEAGAVANYLVTQMDSEEGPSKSVLQALATQVGERGSEEDDAGALLGAIRHLATGDTSLARSLIGSLLETRNAAAFADAITESGGPAAAQLQSMLVSAESVAFDAARTEAQRATAIRRLRLRGLEPFRADARKLLDSGQTGAVQTAAIDALGSFTEAEIGEDLLAAWKGFAPAARERALGVLMRRKAWVSKLLDAVEEGSVTRADLGATRIAALSAHGEEAIRQRAGEIFSKETFAARDKVVARYQPALEKEGDPVRGKAVFGAMCTACHRIEGVGYAIGAELTGIMNRGADAVMLNILDPNREVHADFLVYSVVLEDGAVETGMIRAESSSAVTLRRVDGSEIQLLRANIDEIASIGTSFMPEGLEAVISIDAMADLLAYLDSVK